MFLRYKRFAFYHRGLKGKLYTFRGAFNSKIFCSDHCIKFMIVRNFCKSANKKNFSTFKLIFLHKNRIDSYQPNLNGKFQNFGGIFHERNFDFDPCIQNLIVRKVRKVLSRLKYKVVESHFFP